MSTRCARRTRGRTADEVAAVACERRALLLRVHGFRLRREDLEDCYSQAALELIAQAQRGATFASRVHISKLLELRFLSRVRDRRRALSGRSAAHAALEQAASLDADGAELDVPDERASVEHRVIVREELRELAQLAHELTEDQRRALAAQLAGVSGPACCRRWGWSQEKYRKVGQRARLRLRDLRERSE